MSEEQKKTPQWWGAFVQALPVIILALIGWGVRSEIVRAEHETRLDRLEQVEASVAQLEKTQTRVEVKLETLDERTRRIQDAIDQR